jgi:hypothetical protein
MMSDKPSITEDEARGEYIAGLRALADLLDQHPDVPTPYHGHDVELAIFTRNKDELITTARALPGKLDKAFDARRDVYGFELHGKIHGLQVIVYAHRDQVCHRVVTGTRQVTKTVPAPDAPMVEITETVEDVEWQCEPLLAEATR